MDEQAFLVATIVHWLQDQLRQPVPEREQLAAAVANNDPAEFRRILARAPFSPEQRRYLEDLVHRWERATTHPRDDADPAT